MESRITQICLICLNLLDRQKKKSGRPEKLKKEAYLKEILYVLRTGIQWKELRSELHWSTYYKKFCKWANSGVFRTSFELLHKIMRKGKYLKESSYKKLYIDATMIKNVKGKDLIGVNHYDRGKKGSKISLLVTKEGIPLNLEMVSSNVHDLTAFKTQIEKIKIKFMGSRIIGDKGYVSKKLKESLEKDQINLITPHKKNSKNKNSKNKNSDENRELLRDRSLVENVFSWIQQRRRIRLRYEVHSKYYLEFYYLCLIDIIFKKKDI
jgi:transposase